MDFNTYFDKVGGSYDEVIGRLGKDERIVKYTKMFLSSPEHDDLLTAISDGNFAEAFRHSHSMKGVCANLGLENLRKSASDLCEELRPCGSGENPLPEPATDITPLLEKVKEDYAVAVEAIKEHFAD